MFMSEIFLQEGFVKLTRDILLPNDKAYLESENASAVSLTLPLSEEAYSSKTLFSFFDGLIPEGWLLDVVSRNWKSITGTDSVCYWLPARIVSVMLQLWRKNYEMSVLWKRY